LEAQSYDVVAAADGLEALEQVKRHVPERSTSTTPPRCRTASVEPTPDPRSQSSARAIGQTFSSAE
jgi:CheY-like chemotaxis protein